MVTKEQVAAETAVRDYFEPDAARIERELFGDMPEWELRRWTHESNAVMFARDRYQWQAFIYGERAYSSLVWC